MRTGAILVGVAGLAASVLGWFLDAAGFYAGWLAAVVLLASWSIGSMAILLVHALTGGEWGKALQPALRMGVWSLPLLLLAVLPLIPGMQALYPWARPDAAHRFGNLFYLNEPFLIGRVIAYFVVWFVLGGLVLLGRGLEHVAPPGLFILGVVTTFAAIDATMSLDPHFTSSIYGMLTAAEMGLLAMAVAVLLTTGKVDEEMQIDFGKLLLALAVLWTYFDFTQLLIVWQSNLVAEVPWYLQRARGLWGAVWLVTIAGHFVLPFFILVIPQLRRQRRVIAAVAGLLVATAVLRAWWSVLPSFDRGIGWIAVVSVLGLGGCALALASWAGHPARAEAAHV